MLKKLAIGTAVASAILISTPNFRKGFKMGWNEEYDKGAAVGNYPPRPFNRKFKNV